MGNTCVLEKIESEEETITRTSEALFLSSVETQEAYREFLKCLINSNKQISPELFEKFLRNRKSV